MCRPCGCHTAGTLEQYLECRETRTVLVGSSTLLYLHYHLTKQRKECLLGGTITLSIISLLLRGLPLLIVYKLAQLHRAVTGPNISPRVSSGPMSRLQILVTVTVQVHSSLVVTDQSAKDMLSRGSTRTFHASTSCGPRRPTSTLNQNGHLEVAHQGSSLDAVHALGSVEQEALCACPPRYSEVIVSHERDEAQDAMINLERTSVASRASHYSAQDDSIAAEQQMLGNTEICAREDSYTSEESTLRDDHGLGRSASYLSSGTHLGKHTCSCFGPVSNACTRCFIVKHGYPRQDEHTQVMMARL